MSLCINNDLLWLSIPKCASMSVEYALVNSDLKIVFYSLYEIRKKTRENKHAHYRMDDLYDEFGHKDSFCVFRDPSERFVSALLQIIKYLSNTYKTIIKHSDINNDFIYEHFNVEYMNNLYSLNMDKTFKCYQSLVIDKLDRNKIPDEDIKFLWLLFSQKFWKMNIECTYEFSIKNLHELENFIKDRYDVKITIPKLNKRELENKVVFDEKLKNYLTEILDAPFIPSKILL